MEQTFARELLDFLDASPSCYHAAANVAAALEQAGYRCLREYEPRHLEQGRCLLCDAGPLHRGRLPHPHRRCPGLFAGSGPQRFPPPSSSGRRQSLPPPRQLPAAECGALRRRHLAVLAGSAAVGGRPGDGTERRRCPQPPCQHRPGSAGDPQRGHPHGPGGQQKRRAGPGP